MSLFGPIDDVDRRIWQQRGLKALSAMVELGVKKKLPPLAWNLPGSGGLVGTVPTLGRDHDPRAVFEAWAAALDAHPRVEPRRPLLHGHTPLPTRSERTTSDGQTRLWAGYTFRLVSDAQHPSTDLTLIAEWWEDEHQQGPSAEPAEVARG